jgi:hypothetical protein
MVGAGADQAIRSIPRKLGTHPMTEKAKQFRKYAQDARDMARRAGLAVHKSSWLAIAEAWDKLAQNREIMEHSRRVAEERQAKIAAGLKDES